MSIRFSGSFEQITNLKHIVVPQPPSDPFFANVASVVSFGSLSNAALTSGFSDGLGNTYKSQSATGVYITNAVTLANAPVLALNGGTSSYIFSQANPTGLSPTNKNFTIEGYFNIRTLTNSGSSWDAYLFSFMTVNGNSNDDQTMSILVGGTSTAITALGVQAFSTSGSSQVSSNFPCTFPFNQWVYVAISRSGSSLFYFVNGTLLGTANIGTYTFTSPAGLALCIGGLPWTSFDFGLNGYCGGFRYTLGVCRYTASFTPPPPPIGI